MPRTTGDGIFPGMPSDSAAWRWPAVAEPELPIGSRALPPWQRRRLARLYRFAALVQLVAGEGSPGLFDRLEADLNDVLAGDRVGQPIVNELRRGRRRYPEWALRHLVAAGRQDQLGTTYRDHDQLAAYCELSGGSMGVLTVHALAAAPERSAAATAMAICSAARLIVVCASVTADARSGRCYVPTAELEFHGVTPEQVIADLPSVSGSVSQVVSGLAARAMYELQDGIRGIPRLALPARWGIAGVAAEAVTVHRELQRAHFDVLRPPRPMRRGPAARRLPRIVRGRI